MAVRRIPGAFDPLWTYDEVLKVVFQRLEGGEGYRADIVYGVDDPVDGLEFYEDEVFADTLAELGEYLASR